MHRSTRMLTLAAGLALAAGLLTAPPVAAGPPAHDDGCRTTRVVAPPTARHWDPVTDALWEFRHGQVVLTRPGTDQGGPRRPFEYAVVTKGPRLSTLRLEADVRIDEAVEVTNRDVVLIWNYQSPTRFHYAHLSTDNTIYPHNGIFVVDDADRLRIDDQWDEEASRGAPPAITDDEWHHVRVTHDTRSGEIAVHVDGAREPLMTATDTTLTSGRFGFGSFDNFGRARHVRAVGTVASP